MQTQKWCCSRFQNKCPKQPKTWMPCIPPIKFYLFWECIRIPDIASYCFCWIKTICLLVNSNLIIHIFSFQKGTLIGNIKEIEMLIPLKSGLKCISHIRSFKRIYCLCHLVYLKPRKMTIILTVNNICCVLYMLFLIHI